MEPGILMFGICELVLRHFIPATKRDHDAGCMSEGRVAAAEL
jgi:hypothetical protein